MVASETDLVCPGTCEGGPRPHELHDAEGCLSVLVRGVASADGGEVH